MFRQVLATIPDVTRAVKPSLAGDYASAPEQTVASPLVIVCDSCVVADWTDPGTHPDRPIAGLHPHRSDDEAWIVLHQLIRPSKSPRDRSRS
jgi:hypothetical protein